jgi:hypothetical protein
MDIPIQTRNSNVLRSDAEHLLRRWTDGEKKVFKRIQEFMPAEYVTFLRRNDTEMQFVESDSTCSMADCDHETFIRFLTQEELVFEQNFDMWTNVKKLKTGNCNCGSWIIPDSDYMHDSECPKSKNISTKFKL